MNMLYLASYSYQFTVMHKVPEFVGYPTQKSYLRLFKPLEVFSEKIPICYKMVRSLILRTSKKIKPLFYICLKSCNVLCKKKLYTYLYVNRSARYKSLSSMMNICHKMVWKKIIMTCKNIAV